MSQSLLAVLLLAAASASSPAPALHHVVGSDFIGGAKDLFGDTSDGERVNYIYAAGTGPHARISTRFAGKKPPAGPLFVHLKARDDDFHSHCPIRITLNDTTIFDGPNPFAHPEWSTHAFAVPDGGLKAGDNILVIENRATEGKLGMPPWFQVAECAIAPKTYVITRDLTKDFHVTIPRERRPFPEPLPDGRNPGFKWRGTKSWMWTPEQCLAEIPVMARCKMNFFMNCYTAMCDVEHFKWGDPQVNRWWEDLPETKKKAYEQIVRLCQKLDVNFCFSMNPNLCSKRAVTDTTADIDQLFKHYAWMQGLGVQWFNISLDDITQGIHAGTQARVVNEIFRRLRAKDPKCQMIFCPTYYWGDGTGKEQKPYLEELATALDSEIYVFWTGDGVVGPITREAADTFRGIVRHRVFLWDNYPVNDARPTMHLGPVLNRDASLCEVIDGYMGNAMCAQNEGNRIPLLTCADYAWNPWAYDPNRSIGQAILHLGENDEQQGVMRDLVEAYPGMLVYNSNNTGSNAVLDLGGKLLAMPHARPAALGYVARLEQLSTRIDHAFPGHFRAEKKTLDDDIQILKKKIATRYGDN